MNRDAVERAAREFLLALGINLNDPNFRGTPRRIASAFIDDLLIGSNTNLETQCSNLLMVQFPSDYDGIVAVEPIEAHGVCPHHFLPVSYRVQVGYIAKEMVVGLSKIPRVIKLLAARPIMQEQFTSDIILAIEKTFACRGIIAIVRGKHSCMNIRGVKATDAYVTTSTVSGLFSTDPSAKQEFLDIIGRTD